MRLIFDSDLMIEDLKQRLIVVMDELNDAFYKEAISGMSLEGIQDSDKENAHISTTSEYKGAEGTEFIVAQCKFYADAIMDSFGVGALMDTSSKYLKDYMESDMFNKTRNAGSGFRIFGRPQGTYTNIYGEKMKSTGKNAGKPIPDPFEAPNGEIIESRIGTHSIQTAENFIMRNGTTRNERRIQMEIEKFFSEVSQNPTRYFRVVGD